jgi:uncharacterized membrane protein YphA (DoxX/SURF4 family)
MMDKVLGIQNTTLKNAVLLASRLLLAWIFVYEGVFLATNFAAASASMAKSAFLRLLSLRPSACSLLPAPQLRWDGMHV